ncbi:MAG: UDP-N-acetylglucosamine pyrophosphorylase [Hyphomicrobiaceae bacterium]
MSAELAQRLELLQQSGVTLVDPRQVYISDDVALARIHAGAVLYPGTRLAGARTLIAANARIGTEGPAVLQDTVIGHGAEVASGFLDQAVLLNRARAGANAHFRSGTLLEEEASTAHAVGLKQTILMCYVTAGSLINFCDALVSGGRSREDHSEIGSGFIHFNFTPWGRRGDKATASLIGNVVDGVFLDQDRIFLGGLSGLVGPQSIGFGVLTVAGQIIRRSISNNSISSQPGAEKLGPWKFGRLDRAVERVRANVRYITQLLVLKAWYQDVRLHRARENQSDVSLQHIIAEAIATIDDCIDERLKRFNAFARERKTSELAVADLAVPHERAPKVDWKPEQEYTAWVLGLDANDKTLLRDWLASNATDTEARLNAKLGN